MTEADVHAVPSNIRKARHADGGNGLTSGPGVVLPLETVGTGNHDTGRLIAGLIDGELERRMPQSFHRWSATALGLPPDRLRFVRHRIDGAALDVVAYRIAGFLDQATLVAAADGSEDVAWRTLELPDDTLLLPCSVRAALPAGTLLDAACTVEIDAGTESTFVAIAVRLADWNHLPGAALGGLLAGRTTSEHPYRNRVVHLDVARGQLDARAIHPPEDIRDQLVLPASIWAEVDRNIHGVIRNRTLLTDLGLGLNRGILLHGPPGTGKTQIARTIISELAGEVTALLVSTDAMRSLLPSVYELAAQLSPSIVVLEDIDLIARRRDTADTSSLIDFLTSIDGLTTSRTSVLTIGTTNDPATLDHAAIRAARFDRIIEVPLPPPVGRQRIWRRYLDGLDCDFDIDQLVRVTDGASGADIRELVRHAILDTDGHPTTRTLTELARANLGPTSGYGQYL